MSKIIKPRWYQYESEAAMNERNKGGRRELLGAAGLVAILTACGGGNPAAPSTGTVSIRPINPSYGPGTILTKPAGDDGRAQFTDQELADALGADTNFSRKIISRFQLSTFKFYLIASSPQPPEGAFKNLCIIILCSIDLYLGKK